MSRCRRRAGRRPFSSARLRSRFRNCTASASTSSKPLYRIDVAREQLRSEEQTVVNNVKRTYYAVLQTESALESVRQALTFYRELDRVTVITWSNKSHSKLTGSR